MDNSAVRRLVSAVLVALVAIAAAAIGMGVAGAPTSVAAAQYHGPYDLATGSGERFAAPFSPRKISFAAQDGPSGVSGHARSQPGTPGTAPLTDFSGDVTCLLVQGPRAVVGGVIEKAEIEEIVGATFMFAVEDNGSPSAATPDQLSAYFIDATLDPQDCTIGTNLYPTLAPSTSGNLKVYDAP